VLKVDRKASGKLTISLTAARVKRGIELELGYAGGRDDIIGLPRL
jgi:hypothetical protein